ncbi:DUF1566 domain-containing protein [Ralstonia holmesii]|uniref:DUF1566 domain-containing protein n=1 Tax=Ralstonia holmesii TaxID=3058602 RepID=UPI0028F56732|nr:DUF1566 domain-containing protein [Ralstonia sp. LMG 32967]CAJ0698621.1 hypothetical protein R11007_02844 [Ralstonia sp. LMG 32967]
MTAVTLEDIEEKQAQLEADHARIGQLIKQFKEQPRATEYRVDAATIPLAPGERLAGPIYAEDGTLDYYLIKLPGDGGDLSHADAIAYASGRGGKVPNRREGRLLMANLGDEFDKVAYWLEETYEHNSAYAWYQYFGDGGQYYGHKSAALRAVAVRRFIPSVI